MNMTKAILAATAVALMATSASALTISNRDARAYKLEINQDGKTNTVEIQPNEELKDVCQSACQITIEGDPEPYELEVADVVQIEEGQFYFADEAPAQEGQPKAQ